MSSMSPDFFNLDAIDDNPQPVEPVPVLDNGLSLDLPSDSPPTQPANPLNITDDEGHEAAKLVANAGTSQMGRIAAGLDSAVRVGRDNGLIPKRRWPWQH